MYWNRSIKNRLITIILSVCVVSLCIGMFTIGVSYYNSNKASMIADSITQARLLAEHSEEAILSENHSVLKGILGSAVMDTHSSAAIFDSIGHKLAMRDNDGFNYISEAEYKNTSEIYWGPQYLYVWEVIGTDDLFLGIVYLKISTGNFDSKIRTYALSSFIILMILV